MRNVVINNCLQLPNGYIELRPREIISNTITLFTHSRCMCHNSLVSYMLYNFSGIINWVFPIFDLIILMMMMALLGLDRTINGHTIYGFHIVPCSVLICNKSVIVMARTLTQVYLWTNDETKGKQHAD